MAVLEEESVSSTIPQDLLESVNSLQVKASLISEGKDLIESDWEEIKLSARKIANGLREATLRTDLGKTTLISSCGKLLGCVGITIEERLGQTELLRIIGNLCFDHDENRALSHVAVLPSLLSVLSNVLGLNKVQVGVTEPLSMDDLTLVRASVGALLNMSLKYDPVREDLMKPTTLSILLALIDSRTQSNKTCTPIYLIGSWVESPPTEKEEWEKRIQIGSSIMTWSMNIIEDLLIEDKSFFPESGVAALASVILTPPPTHNPNSATLHWDDEEEITEFLETDLHFLSTASSLLEALSIDSELAKQEIAFSPYSLTPSSTSTSTSTSPSSHTNSLLFHLFNFIESTSSPSYWKTLTSDPEFGIKAFGTIKSAVVRSVIEAPNSDVVMNKLFEEGNLDLEGKSWIINQLVKWMEVEIEGREDLLILGSHMLAALGRKDEYCLKLVQEYGLARPLSKLVKEKSKQQFIKSSSRPGENTQILFGVVSLLRHLAIPSSNKELLGEGDIIESISALLVSELDIVGPLQASVIGLLKQLTVSNISNSVRFVTSLIPMPPSISAHITSTPPPTSTPLDFVLALISRTDDVRLRSESTRILVNVVRTLFSTKPININNTDFVSASPITPVGAVVPNLNSTNGLDEIEILNRRGKPKIVRIEVVEALSEMVRLSEKYPMLINEGIVALTLLAGSGAIGALLVLDSLIKAHSPTPIVPSEEVEETEESTEAETELPTSPTSTNQLQPPPQPRKTTSLAVSPLGDPTTSLGMLINWLGLASSTTLATTTSPKFANGVHAGMVANACALLITVNRGGQVAKAEEGKLIRIKVGILGPLQGIGLKEGIENGLKISAKRALEIVEG